MIDRLAVAVRLVVKAGKGQLGQVGNDCGPRSSPPTSIQLSASPFWPSSW